MTFQLISGLPFFLGIVVGTVALSLLVYSLGRRFGARAAAQRPEGAMDSHVSATLALLAFTLAIVFSQAHGRHAERRRLLREDVVSIRTAYDRVDLLGAAAAAQARAQIREYTRLRVLAPRDEIPLDQFMADCIEIQRRLWNQAAAQASAPHLWFYMEALNRMTAIHGERVTMGVHDHTPMAVWIVLGSVTLLAMAISGYQSGVLECRRSWPKVALVLAYSLLACLAVDLDRSADGIIWVDQGPMERLHEELTAATRR